MDKQETIAALRNLADALELSDDVTADSLDIKLSRHHTGNPTDRNALKAWANLMDGPEYTGNGNHHWISGDVAGVNVTVFFEAHHVLGTVEDAIADLLPEPVEPEPATT